MPAHRTLRIAALIAFTALAFEGSAFAQEPAAKRSADEPAEANKAEGTHKESFRIGPLLGLSFPRPLVVGAFAKIHRTVGLGAEYGFLPKTALGPTAVELKGIAGDLRIFPFQGAFFLGVRGGKQWLDGTTTLAGAGDMIGTAAASTWFVNPRIGFLKTWDSGITVGVDAGVQVPIRPTLARSGGGSSAGASEADELFVSMANALGNETTPTIDLLRVGFLF